MVLRGRLEEAEVGLILASITSLWISSFFRLLSLSLSFLTRYFSFHSLHFFFFFSFILPSLKLVFRQDVHASEWCVMRQILFSHSLNVVVYALSCALVPSSKVYEYFCTLVKTRRVLQRIGRWTCSSFSADREIYFSKYARLVSPFVEFTRGLV